MTRKYFNALNDSMFKAIFLNPDNRDLLKRLIEESINRSIIIKEVSIKELPKHKPLIKGKTLDVICETDDKKIVNVEVNNYFNPFLRVRNFGYISQVYADSLLAGESYMNSWDVYQINLTNTKEDIPAYEVYQMRGKINNKTYINNLTIIEFNLPKLQEECYNKFDFIRFLLKNKMEGEDAMDKDIKKLDEEIKRLNNDQRFFNFLSDEQEDQMLLNTYKDMGRKEGLTAGLEEGIKEGSKSEKIAIAKNLLNMNMDIDDIVKATGLSLKEVESLKA